MYLGAGLIVVGYGFYVHSLLVLLLAAAMWIAVHLFVYFYEEPTLRAKFNGSYENYCRNVSRWLPRPPHGEPLAAQISSANRRNSRDEMRCPPLTSLAFRHRIRAIVVSSARLRVLQEYALRQGLLTYPKVKLKPIEEIP